MFQVTERPKKQEVKDVKRVEKNAQVSQRGHQNRQNTVKGTHSYVSSSWREGFE